MLRKRTVPLPQPAKSRKEVVGEIAACVYAANCTGGIMVVWQRACIDQLNPVAAGSHYSIMHMILRGNERPRGVQPASCQW